PGGTGAGSASSTPTVRRTRCSRTSERRSTVSFESLLGNATAIARLRGILERKRPAHAYLFSGPEGVGKKIAAVEFARALGARVTVIQRPEDKHEILIAQVHELIRELNYTSSEP